MYTQAQRKRWSQFSLIQDQSSQLILSVQDTTLTTQASYYSERNICTDYHTSDSGTHLLMSILNVQQTHQQEAARPLTGITQAYENVHIGITLRYSNTVLHHLVKLIKSYTAKAETIKVYVKFFSVAMRKFAIITKKYMYYTISL